MLCKVLSDTERRCVALEHVCVRICMRVYVSDGLRYEYTQGARAHVFLLVNLRL